MHTQTHTHTHIFPLADHAAAYAGPRLHASGTWGLGRGSEYQGTVGVRMTGWATVEVEYVKERESEL